MRQKLTNWSTRHPRSAKVLGIFFIVIGFVALVTPLTPGGVLFFVGLEIMGWRLISRERLYSFFRKKKHAHVPSAHAIEADLACTPTSH